MAQVLLYPYVLNSDLPSNSHQSLVQHPTPSHPPNRTEQLATSFLSQLTRHQQAHEESLTSVLASIHPLKKGLFDEIGAVAGRSSTMEFLIKLARQPIPETKLGAVDILRSLAYQDNVWGLQTLIRNVGFYNYIKVCHLPICFDYAHWSLDTVSSGSNDRVFQRRERMEVFFDLGDFLFSE
jgi:hypothetical protein